MALDNNITTECSCKCCEHPCECCSIQNPVTPNESWFWMKDSSGVPSASVTFATIAFCVTTIAYLMSVVENVGPLHIRSFDISACSSYFIPILSLYFGRKWTDAKYNSSNTQ